MSTVFGYMQCDVKSPVNAVKLGINGIHLSFSKQLHTEKQLPETLGNL
ncbi:hypothetical protein [Pelosinus sp. UFO1]|nr:hypothetical protein [Pelosinus sp. UFO1]AIF53086.1 hypothetical protein UFO1_3543 [Pelosinus sp. UFO1]